MRRLLTTSLFCLLTIGCTSPKISVKADAAFTQQAAKQSEEAVPNYGTFEDLTNFYLTLPPPPVVIINQPPIITPAPNAPDPYGPLISFIQAGPSGTLIPTTQLRTHLVSLTPLALSLAQMYLSGMTLQQIGSSPQAWQLLYAAQGILQPLGLWNQQTLQQWINYLQPRQQSLINIATSLYNNLVSPPPPGQPTVTPVPPTVIAVNPIELIQKMTNLWKSKDWLAIAEKFPSLIFPLIKHAGFSKPMIVLYGSRRRYYAPSAQTMRIEDGHIEVHNLNSEGYYKNEYASGNGRFFQGLDDISLTYFPVTVRNKRVKTLDVVASDRFSLLKHLSGGNLDLLSRASSPNFAALSIDAAFNNRHLRVVGGSTPYASMGGVMGEITYETEYLSGRLGGGGLIDSSLHGNVDTFVGFLDMEHVLRTPYAMVESKDRQRAAFAWSTLTLSVSGMADRALTEQPDKRFVTKWGFQGDVRLIPELHAQVDGEYFSIYVYGGSTIAVVPVGRVNLDYPERSIFMDAIRLHVGAKLRVLVSKAVKDFKDSSYGHTMYADAAIVIEHSDLVRRGRVTTDFTFDQFKIGFIGELEDFQFDGIDDIRVGGRASFMGAYIQGLKSLELDDFQLQAGFRIEL